MPFSEAGTGVPYGSVKLPWTKTTKSAGFRFPITHVDDPTSPVPAMKRHLKSSASVPADAPMFAYAAPEDPRGWAPLTRDWFLDRCNAVWRAEGLGTLTGHCFRIGGAAEHLLRGTEPTIVQQLGGWKSQAFLDYWWRIKSMLPLFISKTFTTSRLQSTRSAMARFRRGHGL